MAVATRGSLPRRKATGVRGNYVVVRLSATELAALDALAESRFGGNRSMTMRLALGLAADVYGDERTIAIRPDNIPAVLKAVAGEG